MKLEIEWLGYCNKGYSDKVWGACSVSDPNDHDIDVQYYYFWGKRGKSFTLKRDTYDAMDLHERITAKEDQGYWLVPEPEFLDMHPNLIEHLEQTIVLHKLRAAA